MLNDVKYIGLDVHQATISVAVQDCAGKLVMEAILVPGVAPSGEMPSVAPDGPSETGISHLR